MYCVVCGYDLSHLPGDRCPECGTRFDRADCMTYSMSPRLLLRLLRHLPYLHGLAVERFGTVHCRCCGRDLAAAPGHRCPGCNSWFDRADLTTVLRSFRFVPAALLRFHHVCFWRGVLAPLAFLAYGLSCVLSADVYLLPAWPRPSGDWAYLRLSGGPAMAMGAAWIGAALGLHAWYFWGRVEPWWRYAAPAAIAGAVLAAAGWGYAMLWKLGQVLGP